MNYEPNSHCQTWDLVPWVVNGTATPEQQRRVREHLQTCADCRDEYALQQRLRSALQADAERVSIAPAQPALARLLARIDAQDAAQSADAAHAAAPARSVRWTPWLAAAVFVQAIGIALLGGVLLGRPAADVGQPAAPAADYRTLSSPPAAHGAAAIRLVVAPDTTLAALRRLLGEGQWRIVDSNVDNGSFALAPAAPGRADPARVAAALLHLRGQPGVLLAEPIAGAAGEAN